ncbi:MAG: Com family DNA-binding transcriptional regulator [Chloroflexota bacterium]|nr:Com family DNA-binding transcriptional regulator [Chloroflexota bacterium]
MQEYHCGKCKKLLLKGRLLDPRDVVEIRCRSCGLMNTYRAEAEQAGNLQPDGLGGYVLTKAPDSA